MDIIPLDIDDPAIVDSWYETLRAAGRAEVPDFPEVCRYGRLAGLRHPWPGNRVEYWVAVEGEHVVGSAELSLPTLDNLDNAYLELYVHPGRRRRGVGAALFDQAADRARANGRKRLMGNTAEPLPGGPERDPAGSAFAGRTGADRVHGEVRRRLVVGTVDDAVLDRLLAEAWSRADGYDLVTWRDSTPEDIVGDVAYLDGRLVTDAPMGDLAWEKENIDATRVRAAEAASRARGRRSYSAGAVHRRTGRLAAYTTIAFDQSPDSAWHAFQNITIVDPDHRGRRLGTVVKVANLNLVRAAEPAMTTVDTWNAATNGYMISINEAMGFRAVDHFADWQLEL